MKKQVFKFKGDWEFTLIIKNFDKFNSFHKPNECLIDFEIFDELNSNPDPEDYQINTINYLLNEKNQAKVVASILEYSKNTVYPNYQTFFPKSDYPECYPKLEKVEDLNNLYVISRVIIRTIEHEDYAYYTLACGSCLDDEHGITITLFKDIVIDHGEEWDDKKICAHKGIDYKSYYDKCNKDNNSIELIFSEPHPKYGKLKPWQERQNNHYPFALFHRKRDEELIEGIKSGLIPKEPVSSKILEFAITHERESLIQYFIKQNPEYKSNAFREALNKDRFDLADLLIEQDNNLCERLTKSSVFYETINDLITAINKNEEIEKFRKRLKYLLDNGFNPYLKGKYTLNSEGKYLKNSLSRIKYISDEILRDKVQKEVMGIVNSNSKFSEKE